MRAWEKALDLILSVALHAALFALALFTLYLVVSCFLYELGVGDGPRESLPRCKTATRLVTKGLL